MVQPPNADILNKGEMIDTVTTDFKYIGGTVDETC